MRYPFAFALAILLPTSALQAEPPQPQKASEPSKDSPAKPSEKKGEKPESPKKKKKRGPKTPVSAPDYAQWERLDHGNRALSPNGKWLLYGVTRVDEESSLHLHSLKGKKKSHVITYKQGGRPLFSNDSAWLSVTIGKSPAEKKKSPTTQGSTIHLRHLLGAKSTEFKNVKSLTFSDNSRFAALEVAGQSADKNALIIRDLKNGTDTTFGNVTRFAWSDTGSHLAMVIDSPTISNSLQIFEPAIGFLHTLESSEQEYTSLHWRKDAFDLAVMREMKHEKGEDATHLLLLWRDLQKTASNKLTYDHTKQKKFPAKMHLINGGITFSKDGKAIFCDLKEWETKPKSLEPKKKGTPKKKEDKPEPPKDPAMNQPADSTFKEKPEKTLREAIQDKSNVEVWHTKDTDIMPLQKRLGGAQKNPKRRAVWWPEKGTFIQLTTDLTEQVIVNRDGKRALGFDKTPHDKTAMFGPRLQDAYAINTTTGKRKLILKGVKYTLSTSPNGRYLIYLRKGQIWSHDLKSGKQRNLSKNLKTNFTNQEDDTLAVEKRPYGPGTWLTDSSGVLLYDRFDIWLIAPDGSSAKKLTNGNDEMIRHRLSLASFSEKDEGSINPKKPLYIALYGERNKKSGYAKLPAIATPGKLQPLLWDDKFIMSLARARDANVFLHTKESAKDSPDLFVSGPDLAKAKQISKTNPFQKKFRWGHSELIDFKNDHGVELQGALHYPANYKPGKKYPMIVYIYEERSQDLHRYHVPSEKHPYNPAVYSAEGYFVFQPDIVYRPQEPGISALECVVPAVKEVIKTGMIDEKKVGLVGHSWGAYQTAFIVTRSDVFAAGVAGAPLTNMMSMSVSVYWNSGQTNAAIFTQSQGRMNKPFWRDVDTYVRNSPIHGLDSLNTPLLIAFGDKDGAVDWGQGVQMYNAARWAGKDNMVMLVYPGENHGLRKPENMVDYHYRVLEWFDTHVKGNEAPRWITDGKSYLDREAEKAEKKEDNPTPTKPAEPKKKDADPKAKKGSEKSAKGKPTPTSK
ncbi:MAG: dipeptidyl aminopeptidase/acylaminoacyl peptidase [Akkermansiaceae bacterium]|jgi:dipeptidyl aminopeptidase/acylaminoacyl peptidase